MTAKYKDTYTVEDLRLYITEQGGIRAAARWINRLDAPITVTESGIREFLRIHGENSSENIKIAAGNIHSPDATRPQLTGTRFVFTCAQNNTYVHENFLSALLVFCEHNQAQLVVSRFAYNKAGFQNGTKDKDSLWYDRRLEEYTMNYSAKVAEGLVFCGELDILPTAANPLSGFEGYCQGSSGIIPHVKVAMQSLPRMKGEDPRFLYSTGAVTLRNYIQRKAGQKAEFHHVFGALYVEVDQNGNWHARQLIADSDTGAFYDLTTKYSPEGVEKHLPVLALNYGDIHAERLDFDVRYCTWSGVNSIAATLQPSFHFIHDLTDFSSRNHHNIKDKYFLAQRHYQQEDSVKGDLLKSASVLATVSKYGGLVVVVDSNHDQAFKRWLNEADVTMDPGNAEYWHLMNARVYQSIREGDKRFNIYEHAIRELKDLPDVVFLQEDDSFRIGPDETGGIECGLHGHRGPNGARGTIKNLKCIGSRVNLGHSHSAGIIDGAYAAGVSAELDLGYNKGPSSWSHSHIVTYANGKRAIITIKNGRWRA